MYFYALKYQKMKKLYSPFFLRTAFVVLFMLAFVRGWGQIFSNPITGTNPSSANPYTTGQTVDTNITVSGIGRGTGIIGTNTNNRYNAEGWNSTSLNANDYFTFTLTPNSGYEINFISFIYSGQASGTGPTSFVFRSSLDGYVANIGTATAIGTTIDLSSASYQNLTSAVTFRIYAWGASAPTGTFSINDFIFNGTVSAVSTTPANVALSSSNPASTVGNLVQGTTNNVIYGFNLTATLAAATLNQLDFTTTGGYSSAEVSNYKLWYSADNVFGAGDTTIGTLAASAAGGTKSFTSIGQSIAKDATGYFFITTDIPCTANTSSVPTLRVNAVTTSGLTFSSASVVKSGTANNGAAHTFTSALANNVTAASTSLCVSNSTKVSWTNPTTCFDEVLVFAKAGAFSSTAPTGDGTLYPTASPTFGSGTPFDGGFLIYKGTLATVTALGLTNGTNYEYKIFTRNDSNWSSGVVVNCTPTIAYCTPIYTIGCTADDRITNFILETISNNSGTTCSTSPKGYSDYTAMSTNLTQGVTYAGSVSIASGGVAGVAVWIDFNDNGTFESGEKVYTTSGTFASGSLNNPISVVIPPSANTGIHRMRVRHVYNTNGTTIDPCNSYTHGET